MNKPDLEKSPLAPLAATIFVEAVIKGNLQNPELLIGGEVFAEVGSTSPRDIKKIFEEGIQSLVDSLLDRND